MLGSDDRAALLESLRVIGEASDIVDFGVRASEQLLRLVPGISASYNEVDPSRSRVAAVIHPDPGRAWFEQYTETFRLHVHENPVLAHFEETGSGEVTAWDDVDPVGSFFATTLYREFYEPNGIHSQVVFLLPAPPGIYVAMAVNRDGTAFTSRERALMDVLRVHLVNLYRLVSEAEAARHHDATLTDSGWTVVVVDDDGRVTESNATAAALGARAGIDLGVGADLAACGLWSEASDTDADLWARPRVHGMAAVPVGPSFEARLLRSAVGPHLMWLREPSHVQVSDAIDHGLTQRQAEVAMLLVDGLTNAQIARRLGVSVSTVRKHLEAVFQRLGVQSRAAVVGVLHGAGRAPGS